MLNIVCCCYTVVQLLPLKLYYTCIINLYGFMFVRNADFEQVMDFYDTQLKYINMIIFNKISCRT